MSLVLILSESSSQRGGRIVESFSRRNAPSSPPSRTSEAVAFFRGWTRKEAVLKGIGTGLAGLSAYHETGFGMAELPPILFPLIRPRLDEWRLWEAAPRPGFVATVAVRLRPLSIRPGPV